MNSLLSTLPIGGFFELELPMGSAQPHSRAWAALASGRACLGMMMEKLHPTKVWVPFYICDSVLHALGNAHVSYAFYALNEELELPILPLLGNGEYILYVNYFGLKGDYTDQLSEHYGLRLLLDLTQAFFEEPSTGQWAFNSTRKFFGVPDGAYLYAPDALPPPAVPVNQSISIEHLVKRQIGAQAAAYAAYSHYEEALSYDVLSMSAISRSWLSWLDYSLIAAHRQANFHLYHQLLQPLFNEPEAVAWEWFPLPPGAIPFCYPVRLARPLTDRQPLFEQSIFVPWLWPEMCQRPQYFPLEKTFVDGVLALPLDHRYGLTEVTFVASQVALLLKRN